MEYLFLALSISLSTVRTLLSKKLSRIEFGNKEFYIFQAIIFFTGSASLCIFGKPFPFYPSPMLFYAVIYGILLILAQWMYTAALSCGNTALCSTVYSMGFIIPTISGALFWSEKLNLFDIIGIVFAVLALIFSGKSKSNEKRIESGKYFIPLFISMLSAGGLGLMQKLQQKSDFSDQRGGFLLFSFIIAGLISLIFSFIKKNNAIKKSDKSSYFSAISVGFSFGCCNILNTLLAGILPSALFFPVLNIGVILTTTFISIIFMKEKTERKDYSVLICGILSIVFLTVL